MKEYKSVCIETRDINDLANRLNKCMVDGWYLKKIIHKHIADPGYTHNFYFLLEREKPQIKAKNIPKPPPPPPPRKLVER